MSPQPLLACVEGGGTSFVCCVAPVSDPTNPIDRFEVTTTTPSETIKACSAFLEKYKTQYVALGVATFGPVDLNRSSPTYGYITATPKAAWRFTDVLSPFLAINPNVPHKFDTDVNAPALAEHTLARRVETDTSVAYVTVGTGVGVGLVVNGEPVHGLMHPEGGHVCVDTLPNDSFGGYSWGKNAPYAGRCTVESLASAVGIVERLGHDANDADSRSVLKTLADDDECWNHVANALANLCVSLTLLTSVNRIVLSGGIMLRASLFPKIRTRTRELLNGYVQLPAILDDAELDKFISPSTWGNSAGVVGALNLANVALAESKDKQSTSESTSTALALGAGLIVGGLVGVAAARRR